MKIYLIRHGETDWTKEQRLQGRRDVPLNEKGKEQLSETGKKLANLKICPDVLLCSPLQRAKTSAEIVAEQIGYKQEDIIVEPLFIERDFGSGEGTVIEDLGHAFPDDSYENMESIEETCIRAKKAIDKVLSEYAGKTVVVVAHGAILKALIAQISNGQIEYQDQTIRIAPGSVYQLDYENGKFQNNFLSNENFL